MNEMCFKFPSLWPKSLMVTYKVEVFLHFFLKNIKLKHKEIISDIQIKISLFIKHVK